MTIWVGGMFFAYFCLRPAAARLLAPTERLALWVATLETFFKFVTVAALVTLASGFVMVAEVGLTLAPPGWLLMTSFGMTMAIVFAYVYVVLYGRLRMYCTAGAWSSGATTLNKIRELVGVNLVLAVCAVASAAFSR